MKRIHTKESTNWPWLEIQFDGKREEFLTLQHLLLCSLELVLGGGAPGGQPAGDPCRGSPGPA